MYPKAGEHFIKKGFAILPIKTAEGWIWLSHFWTYGYYYQVRVFNGDQYYRVLKKKVLFRTSSMVESAKNDLEQTTEECTT